MYQNTKILCIEETQFKIHDRCILNSFKKFTDTKY